MTDYPTELIDAIVESTVVPFVGAGISIDSGAPSWGALLRRLIESLGEDNIACEIRQRYESGELSSVDVPELHSLLQGSTFSLLNFLNTQFGRPFRTNKYHHLMRQFTFATVLTTNYDRLIEQSFEEIHRSYNVIWKDSQLRFYNEVKALQVVKIHGTITDVESCVISKGDYAGYAQERPFLYGLLGSIFSVKTVLFLGCSLKDPNIGSLLEQVRLANQGSPREHFAVLHNPSGDDVSQLRKYGIRVIRLTGRSVRQSLIAWLEGLAQRTRQTWSGHINKARAYRGDIEQQTRDSVPGDIVRMRASLGIISIPKRTSKGVVLYNPDQDKAELELGQSMREFLGASRENRYRTIVHINPSLQRRKGFSLASINLRLRAMLEFFAQYPGQIEIAHSSVPIFVNHLIVQDRSSFLGHKRQTKYGPTVLRRTINRWVIQSEIEAFDDDFESMWQENRKSADAVGIDSTSPTWDVELSRLLIDRALTLTEHSSQILRCDDSGTILGLVDRGRAHAESIRHRSVHLHLFTERDDGSVSVLLQERGSTTDLYAGQIDVAVAGHPERTDCVVEVLREAAEELGIWVDRSRVQHAFSYLKDTGSDREYVDVFVADSEGVLQTIDKFESNDVEALYWADFGGVSLTTMSIHVRGFKRCGSLSIPTELDLPVSRFVPQAIEEIIRVRDFLTTQ
ncbi:MAG: SIR2 family protein [Phycisphaerae bacterium]|nr:SIR2 family protein [Phycisphaerae bacterium]